MREWDSIQRVNYASPLQRFRKPSRIKKFASALAFILFGIGFGVIAFVAVTQ